MICMGTFMSYVRVKKECIAYQALTYGVFVVGNNGMIQLRLWNTSRKYILAFF